MPIPLRCAACGQGHKAPETLAGLTLKCRKCAAPIRVPAVAPPPDTEDAAFQQLLEEDTPYRMQEEEPPPAPPPLPTPPPPKPRPAMPAINPAAMAPLKSDHIETWRRHLHWLLVLALIPLMVSLLRPSKERAGFDEDFFDKMTEEQERRLLEKLKNTDKPLDVLCEMAGGKLPGAHVKRDSMRHWLYALIATGLFLTFFIYLGSDGAAKAGNILAVGLITATVGVGLLLIVQYIASAAAGRLFIGKSIIALLFLVLNFIAFSYNCALDPDYGFMVSFLGFTAGVGLLEELVKLLPLFWHRSDEDAKKSHTWRGLFIWGLASGAGFGIAEGIMYSARYYNGVEGSGIYAVRFLSCVALHAIWSGSVAITLYLRRSSFDTIGEWYGWIGPTLMVIAVPMVLHGLYDTCLKKDQNAAALLVALVSFGWLAFLTSRLHGTDDVDATKAMLREYQRRKKLA